MITTHEIRPVTHADIPALVVLAHDTWHRHYPAIISTAQIEYMLAERYHPDVIRAQLGRAGMWWDQLVTEAGLAAFAATETGTQEGEIKIDKLYVSYRLRGCGLGAALLRHIERRAIDMGMQRLYLQVNKHNASAIGAYRKSGFEIVESATFDIGNGFVMDDYIMARVPGAPA